MYAVIADPASVTPGNAATVQIGYAPTGSSDAPSNVWLPRFTPPDEGAPFANMVKCRTSLLFPFVNTASGLDTVISIANTSRDPFGTPVSEGACELNFYGTNAPAQITTPGIAGGATYWMPVSSTGTEFTGYVIAACDFLFPQGFAYFTNSVTQASAGYRALVMKGGTRIH